VLPNRDGRVRIRTNLAGEVEIRPTVGQLICSGQILAIVEGDHEIESLSVRKPSTVEEILVECGSEVPSGTALMVLREMKE
jgi:biotin carboxyl carrier protein